MNQPEIEILFQNSDYVAVNKPAGVSVHNNEDPFNLLQALALKISGKPFFPVHRLDKETSGVQILAHNESAARALSEEFQSRIVQKIYKGVLRGFLKVDKGIWNHSLSDKSEGRKNPAGQSKDRVPCETQFQVIQKSKYFTLCEFQLITGRQHQIRKHAAIANHALVGDARYGETNYNLKMAKIYGTDRMFLHCQRLTIAGQTLECPPPSIFEKLFEIKT